MDGGDEGSRQRVSQRTKGQPLRLSLQAGLGILRGETGSWSEPQMRKDRVDFFVALRLCYSHLFSLHIHLYTYIYDIYIYIYILYVDRYIRTLLFRWIRICIYTYIYSY